MNKQAANFLNSKHGSLWKIKPLELKGRWANLIKSDPSINLFTDLHEATNLIRHEAKLNENYFPIEADAMIINLDRLLILDDRKAAIYLRGVVGEKRVADRVGCCHKVMAMTSIGKCKTGWIFHEDTEILVPYV